jgi:hypothetical protein
MSTVTASNRPTSEEGRPRATPRVELDLTAALAVMQTAALEALPDGRGGIIIDAGCPALAPLLPYLHASGTWAWVRSPLGVASARRTAGSEATVVVDGRIRSAAAPRTCRPDLVVLAVDQVEAEQGRQRGFPALVDLTDARAWRIGSALLAARGGLAGFHLDLRRLPSDDMADRVDIVAHVVRQWALTGRADLPLLVLRGARTAVLNRHVVGAVRRACRSAAVPVPTMRVDVTGIVLNAAVRTVLGVLGVEEAEGVPILDVDALPRSVAATLDVLQGRPDEAHVHPVLLRNGGHLVPALLVGELPAHAGAEIAAPGWTDLGRVPVVRGFRPR